MARRTKTNRSPEFKAKVALAALQDGKTVQQLATLFDVHPTQVQTWKKQLLVGAAEVFQAGVVTDDKLAQDAKEGELLKEVGRLTVELNWLKKKVSGLG
jgi:transposase-like protein